MEDRMTERPVIGIIMLETGFPRIPGDIGNPATFDFPVIYRTVPGATPERVVNQMGPDLLKPFIEAARDLQDQGVKAIATSCGFLAIFQKELAEAVTISVFSSSLLQVHLAQTILKPGRITGILTARATALTPRHLAGVNIDQYPLAIKGMDQAEEFTSVFIQNKKTMDVEKCRKEVVEAAQNLVRENPRTGALVLECANMPAFARDVQKAVNLPVFDVVTLVNQAHSVVLRKRYS